MVERFEGNIRAYKSGDYNETQARGDFIDPLMGLLGWDVHNRQGKAPAYRDVVEEDRVKVGGGTKARGFSQGQISRETALSPNTVKYYLKQLETSARTPVMLNNKASKS